MLLLCLLLATIEGHTDSGGAGGGGGGGVGGGGGGGFTEEDSWEYVEFLKSDLSDGIEAVLEKTLLHS